MPPCRAHASWGTCKQTCESLRCPAPSAHRQTGWTFPSPTTSLHTTLWQNGTCSIADNGSRPRESRRQSGITTMQDTRSMDRSTCLRSNRVLQSRPRQTTRADLVLFQTWCHRTAWMSESFSPLRLRTSRFHGGLLPSCLPLLVHRRLFSADLRQGSLVQLAQSRKVEFCSCRRVFACRKPILSALFQHENNSSAHRTRPSSYRRALVPEPLSTRVWGTFEPPT